MSRRRRPVSGDDAASGQDVLAWYTSRRAVFSGMITALSAGSPAESSTPMTVKLWWLIRTRWPSAVAGSPSNRVPAVVGASTTTRAVERTWDSSKKDPNCILRLFTSAQRSVEPTINVRELTMSDSTTV